MLLKTSKIWLFTFAFCLSAFSQTLSVRDIMREQPSIAGMRPDGARLSPDGKSVVYRWNAEQREPKDVYLVSTSGGDARILVSPKDLLAPNPAPTPENKLNYGLNLSDDYAKSRRDQIGNLAWSPDSKKILFTQNGDLYVLSIVEKSAQPRRLTRTQSAEFSAQWIDNSRILFSQNDNFFVIDTESFSLVQISKEASAKVSIDYAVPTEDGSLVAYVASDNSNQKTLYVPNYIGEFVQAAATQRGFSEEKIYVTKTDGSLQKSFDINLPKAEGGSYLRSVQWAADNRSLIVDRVDKDTKRRQLFYVYNAGGKDAQTILITEEIDPKWIDSLSGTVQPNPKDNSQIFFCSERDGYSHLYLATLERRKPEPNPTEEIRQENSADAGFTANVQIKQLTRGAFEIDWAQWRQNGKEIVFSSTEKNTTAREFYTIDSADRKLQIPSIDEGLKIDPQLSTKGGEDVLLFDFSRWNAPSELYAQRVCPECRGLNSPQKITATVPDSFKQIKWNAPQFTAFKARDGKTISAKIYLPAVFDKSKKYPMVIFVHGAGYLQNVVNGWNHYYREFMFNEILTRKGYVVLDIDYRGSAGYGRDYRTDVYDFLGGTDYTDHLDAIDFMTANYPVDQTRIGVYGGSYGGFMAEMLAFRTDKIACAAALRPVADWKNYFYSSPVYTAERLGFPDKNAEAYRRSSPISYAENLDKPLLILHGLVDDNVPVQDSMQLVEKLIRLEKTEYFEELIYPSESHSFVRPTSWTDEYTRILAFFERHLK